MHPSNSDHVLAQAGTTAGNLRTTVEHGEVANGGRRFTRILHADYPRHRGAGAVDRARGRPRLVGGKSRGFLHRPARAGCVAGDAALLSRSPAPWDDLAGATAAPADKASSVRSPSRHMEPPPLSNVFPQDMSKPAPISTVLGRCRRGRSGTSPWTGCLSGWASNLRTRLLLLSVFGLLPGVSAFAAVLLMIPAIQMLLARSGPVFPRRIRAPRRSRRAERLAALSRYVVPGTRTLAGAVRSPPLDDARRGNQARCWGQCAAVERRPSCSGATGATSPPRRSRSC